MAAVVRLDKGCIFYLGMEDRDATSFFLKFIQRVRHLAARPRGASREKHLGGDKQETRARTRKHSVCARAREIWPSQYYYYNIIINTIIIISFRVPHLQRFKKKKNQYKNIFFKFHILPFFVNTSFGAC